MNFLDKFSIASERLRPNVIREMIKLSHGKTLISFAGGLPSTEMFPAQEIASIVAELVQRQAGSVLQYGVTQGCAELLEQVRQYMHSRGVSSVGEQNLLITGGSQQALDLIGRLLLDPGDVVLVESPSYIGALTAFRNLGADLVGVRQDGEGISLEHLEGRLARLKRERRRAAFLYTIPNFNNPSGVLLSAGRRAALLELAREFDLLVVEDDAYGEIYFSECAPEAVRPLSAQDPDQRVLYTGTFSKTLAPGLRTGWVCASPEIISRLELFKQGADLFSSVLHQRVIAEFLARGWFHDRLPRLRAYYQRRRDAMVAALEEEMGPEVRWNRPGGGFFVWLQVPPEMDTMALMEPAIRAGVAYIPGKPFHVDGRGSNTIRLAYSSESEQGIREGIRTLSGFVRSVRQVKSAV